MRLHSDVWLRDYLAQNPEARDPRIYRDARDPRILPVVGTFLRRYSIDELPQIWNVVRGDMGLVGPRALPDYHCKLLNPEFLAFRSRVRPGITGLWQIEGRSNADPASHRNVRFTVPQQLVARRRSSHPLPHRCLRLPRFWALIFPVWQTRFAGEFWARPGSR